MLIIYGAIKLNTWEKFVQFNRIGNKNIIINNYSLNLCRTDCIYRLLLTLYDKIFRKYSENYQVFS